MTHEKRVNAESFARFLTEIKKIRPWIKDIFYSEHEGLWRLQKTDGEDHEYSSLLELIASV